MIIAVVKKTSIEYSGKTVEVKAPSDYLKDYFQKAAQVKRYEDPRYPAGFIEDDLLSHIQRVINMVDQLDLDGTQNEEIKRMAWVHDLPEVVLGDLPNVARDEGLLEEHDEATVAREMLNDSDLDLYEQVETASDYLKGKSNEIPTGNALILKVLDSIDGNLFFHRHVYDWIKAGRTFDEDMNSALTYTFKQFQNYKDRLSAIDANEVPEVLLAIDLLDFEIEYIRGLWDSDEDLIPESIAFYLSSDL